MKFAGNAPAGRVQRRRGRSGPGDRLLRGVPSMSKMAPQQLRVAKIIRRLFRFLVLIPVLVSLGCPMMDDPGGEGVVVVGSRNVGMDELKRDMAYVSPGLEPSMLRTADALDPLLDRVIERYLIMEYAAETGISVSDEEVAEALVLFEGKDAGGAFQETLLKEYVAVGEWKRRLREHLVAEKVLKRVMAEVPPPSYEDIKAYFEANRQTFYQPEMLRFRQIVTQTREEAETLHDRLLRGEDMGKLAREFSTAPEAENDGEVGWIARGELHESMEGPLFSSEEGEVTRVVKTPYGYHIFEVLAHRPEEKRDLPEVYGRIEFELLSKKRDMYWVQWLKGLRDRFQVRIDHDKLNDMGQLLDES